MVLPSPWQGNRSSFLRRSRCSGSLFFRHLPLSFLFFLEGKPLPLWARRPGSASDRCSSEALPAPHRPSAGIDVVFPIPIHRLLFLPVESPSTAYLLFLPELKPLLSARAPEPRSVSREP